MSLTGASSQEARHLRCLFDAIPLPAFVVDEDVRIVDFNPAAGAVLGSAPEMKLRQRGGEAMHCIQAESKGCGLGEHCPDCVLRLSVKTAICGGVVTRRTHKAEIRSAQGEVTPVDLLITASPLPEPGPPRALLILEDVTELVALRGLLPICCRCKKVRDDKDYWGSLEQYLLRNHQMVFTHGLCPECYQFELSQLTGAIAKDP